MSYSISTLLTRNLHDVFGENDPARRRAAIDEIFTEDCVFYEPGASTVAATRSIASRARSRLLTLTFDISQLPSPRNWAMAGGSNGYRAALVRRQLTPGLISSLLGTAGLPPFISFSTSYPELDSAVMKTLTRRINVERVTVTSHKSLKDVLAKFDAAVGQPNVEEFWKHVAAAKTNSEMESVVQSALGPSGFMEFARFDHSGVVHKGQSGNLRESLCGSSSAIHSSCEKW